MTLKNWNTNKPKKWGCYKLPKQFTEKFFQKSYETYLKKVKDAGMKTYTDAKGRTRTSGVRMQQPRAYEQYKQIYQIMYSETQGVNTLRRIVSETRATSEKQVALAYKLGAHVAKVRPDIVAESPKISELRRATNAEVKQYIKAFRQLKEEEYGFARNPRTGRLEEWQNEVLRKDEEYQIYKAEVGSP